MATKRQTAQQLYMNGNYRDAWTGNRTEAAAIMVRRGYADWLYTTQWASGTCLFTSPDGKRTALVRYDNELKRWTVETTNT